MRMLITALVLLATTSCATVTYEVVLTNGKHIDNEELMKSPRGPDSSEHEAIETQKQRTPGIPIKGFDSPIVLLHSDLPGYPKDVRADQVQGVVEIVFTIDVDGSVKEPRVVSSPDPRLSEVSVKSILKWRFRPLTRDGVPVTPRVRQQFPFRL